MKTPAELDNQYADLLREQEVLSRKREKAIRAVTDAAIKRPTGQTGSVSHAGRIDIDRLPGNSFTEKSAAALELARKAAASPPSSEALTLSAIDTRSREVAAAARLASRRAAEAALAANRSELDNLVEAAAKALCQRFEALAAIYCARHELSVPGWVDPGLPSLYADRLGLGEAVKQLAAWRGEGWLDVKTLTPAMRRVVEATRADSVMGSWGTLL